MLNSAHSRNAHPTASLPPSGNDVAYHLDSELALLEALLEDDEMAWRAFMKRYSGLVFSCISRVSRRFSGVLTSDDVSEIYAMFCLQLIANDKKKLRSFDADRGHKLTTWIGMLATKATYDYLRVIRREPRKDDLSEAVALAAEVSDPVELIVRREQAARLVQMAQFLSARDQRFVELYFGEGLEPEMIAEKLNISIKTVYTKKHKIVAKLESLLGQQTLAA